MVAIYIYIYIYIYRYSTLTEVFPCFFLSCKANARVKLAKTGHDLHSSELVVICVILLLFVLFYVFLCKCVLYYCHRVTTQLQLTNISYHMLPLWALVACSRVKFTFSFTFDKSTGSYHKMT